MYENSLHKGVVAITVKNSNLKGWSLKFPKNRGAGVPFGISGACIAINRALLEKLDPRWKINWTQIAFATVLTTPPIFLFLPSARRFARSEIVRPGPVNTSSDRGRVMNAHCPRWSSRRGNYLWRVPRLVTSRSVSEQPGALDSLLQTMPLCTSHLRQPSTQVALFRALFPPLCSELNEQPSFLASFFSPGEQQLREGEDR